MSFHFPFVKQVEIEWRRKFMKPYIGWLHPVTLRQDWLDKEYTKQESGSILLREDNVSSSLWFNVHDGMADNTT